MKLLAGKFVGKCRGNCFEGVLFSLFGLFGFLD